MKIKQFYDVVYKLPVVVVKFDNENELIKLNIPKLEDEKNIWGLTMLVTGRTKYTDVKGMYIIINSGVLDDPETSMKVGVHESFHASSLTLHAAGIELTPDTEEVYAYHVEWMTSEVLKCFSKM